MSETAARAIVDRLRTAGYQAFYAGGSVRDHLLESAAKDYDVSTDAHPDAVMRLFPRHTAVGARFGVVLVHLGGAHIEVATFRTDASYSDGRHPEAVVYARDPESDVRRRDFTINGLLMDPHTGAILDFVGGRADLTARLIRAIGDPERRFAEDRLRMLRAVRFAARLGFAIEPATLAAIERQADAIVTISHERVRDELLKMLTEGHSRRAFELLDRTRLLEFVLPEVKAMQGVEQPPQYHPEGDVWTHTLMMLGGFDAMPAPRSPVLGLAVLLHDVGKPPTFRRAPDRIRFDRHAPIGARMSEGIARRLSLSAAETGRLASLVEHHMQFGDLPRMRESTRKRFLRRPEMADQLELLRLDSTMSHGDLSWYENARAQWAALTPEETRPPRLLTGHDLVAMGYTPGPRFREILEAIEDAQLEGRFPPLPEGSSAARGFVREHFPLPDTPAAPREEASGS